MTVAEMIALLQQQPSDAEVLVTWEATFHVPLVYRATNNVVIVDGDGGDYREVIESGRLLPAED